MNRTFPPLLDLNVSRHLHPKMRFLQETMGVNNVSSIQIPPQYFGARLERTIAPRHAFLMYHQLPHGRELMENPQLWKDFLLSCRTVKRFCALCNEWQRLQSQRQSQPQRRPITAKEIEAFDMIFGRGVLAAVRKELVRSNNTWPLRHINITSADILQLLIRHGANPREKDIRGTSLLHWAAGTGNLEAVQVLCKYFSVLEPTNRDGATPLHWAAAGANSKGTSIRGHNHLQRIVLTLSFYLVKTNQQQQNLEPVDTQTFADIYWNNARSTKIYLPRNSLTSSHWTAIRP